MEVVEDINDEDPSLKGDVIEITDTGTEQGDNQLDHEKKTQAASEILLEFLEVAIHQILYARKLYPEEIFLLRKKYSVPVYISSHPGLNEYISTSLTSVKKLLQENRICHISVLIVDEKTPIENFLFEMSILQDILSKGQEFIELEQSLRSFILKILSSVTSMENLPDTCCFEILVGCKNDCEVDLNTTSEHADIRWTIVDTGDFAQPLKPNKIIPIKALESSSLMKMQLVVEQMCQSAS